MGTVRYVGRRTKQGVTVTRETDDGTSEPLPLRLDLANHSSSGFEWGYAGSGPSQLALAILSDAVGDEQARYFGNYEVFKFAKIGQLPHLGWVITQEEVCEWYEREARQKEADDCLAMLAEVDRIIDDAAEWLDPPAEQVESWTEAGRFVYALREVLNYISSERASEAGRESQRMTQPPGGP
jgi:hypothetical protein